MNIIGNSCASCFIQINYFNHELLNPFSYNIIDFNSFYYLICNFNKINFKNFKLNLKDNKVICIIDDKIKLEFVHYLYDKTAKTIKKDNKNIYYCDIIKFVEKKYLERLERMNKNKPIFLAASFNKDIENNYNPDEILKILNINSEYKIIIASEYDIQWKNTNTREFIKINRKNIRGNCTNGRSLANYIINNSLIIKNSN